MKSLYTAIFLLFINLNADEIQRIESIVKDIEKLRADYDKSQEALSLSLVYLKDEKDKNGILLKELKVLESEIIILKNQIKELKSNDLPKNNQKQIIKENKIICQENKIIKKNSFPELQMKKEKQVSLVIQTNPQTYRLNKNATIYDGINANAIEEWAEKTSFTSNFKSGNWVRITGYFVERKWQKSLRELWVKEEDTMQHQEN